MPDGRSAPRVRAGLKAEGRHGHKVLDGVSEPAASLLFFRTCRGLTSHSVKSFAFVPISQAISSRQPETAASLEERRYRAPCSTWAGCTVMAI